MENLVLIGLTGSGKTTVGRLAASRLNMDFVDTDDMIEEKTTMLIKDIFAIDGEDVFRHIETEICMTASKLSNTVISTGGGAVLKEINMTELKKNGIVVFINRSPDEILKTLETDERPLLKDDRNYIYKLYEDRIHLYKMYSDIEVENNGNIEKTLDLLEKLVLERIKYGRKY